jgi:hypothetical protein
MHQMKTMLPGRTVGMPAQRQAMSQLLEAGRCELVLPQCQHRLSGRVPAPHVQDLGPMPTLVMHYSCSV